MANQWYLQTKSGRQGPFSDQDLIQMVQQGKLTRGSLLRREGDQSWHRAENIGGLFSRLPEGSLSQSSPSDQGMASRTLPPPLPVKEQGSKRRRRSRSKKRLGYWITGSVLGVLLVGLVLLVVFRPDLVPFSGKPVASNSESTTESAETGTDETETAGDEASPTKETETSQASQESDQETSSKEEQSKLPEQKPESKVESAERGLGKKSFENRIPPKVEESASSPPMPTEVLVEKSAPSVAIILGNYNSGSGFMVGANLLATNRHVVARSVDDDLKIYFPSRSDSKQGPHVARLVYVDPKRDLAFLKVECDIPALPLAENYQFRSGQEIIAIGSPAASAAKYELVPNAVNKGILSAEVELKDDQTYYQMGISINNGNSGGPILNLSGKVVGVATAAEAGDREQITYCIPVGQLIEAKEKAQTQTPAEIEKSRSLHRAGVVYRTATNAGNYYEAAFEIYKNTARDADASGESWLPAIQVAKTLIYKQLPLTPDADLSEIKSHISAATSDSRLPDQLRRSLMELLKNVNEMERMFEKPAQRSIQSLIDKIIDLTDRHHALVEKLKPELESGD